MRFYYIQKVLSDYLDILLIKYCEGCINNKENLEEHLCLVTNKWYFLDEALRYLYENNIITFEEFLSIQVLDNGNMVDSGYDI